MDQSGAIRRVIETEEDVAWETRRLALRIHWLLNPELFPDEEPTPSVRAIDSLHPLTEYPVSRRRIGAPGPPGEPYPLPPASTPRIRAPAVLPPRMRFFQETGRHTRPTPRDEPLPPIAELFSPLPDSAYGAPHSDDEPEAEPMNQSDDDNGPSSSRGLR